MTRPQVIVVGGMAFNIPKELTEQFEIVKHVEQSSSYRVGSVPQAEYIFVISDFASHNLVDVVRNQLSVPVIYLPRGWSGMKIELQKRSILPPDSSPKTRAPEAAATEVPTTTGLSEDELWKLYRTKLIDAAKGTLKPRELVSEEDLLETLGDLVGIPKEDVRLLLPKLHMGGIVVPIRDGVWSLLIGEDSYEYDPSPAPTPVVKRRKDPPPPTEPGISVPSPREKSYDRARKISGLLMGPYPTLVALAREMQKYQEFHYEDGSPISVEGCKNLIKKAIELKIVDDTHQKIYVDHKPEIVLTRIKEAEPEVAPIPQAVLTPEGRQEAYTERVIVEAQRKNLADVTVEEAKAYWLRVVHEVKSQKRHIGTILENGRIEWLASSAILVFLVPMEFSVYLNQLESTENWGLVSSHARTMFGPAVVIRFVLDNASRKVRS